MATMTTDQPRSLWPNNERWRSGNLRLDYDRKADVLYIFALPVEPAGSFNIGAGDKTDNAENEVFLLVKGPTGEIVGVQIDNFRTVWANAHPNIRATARRVTHPTLSKISGLWGATMDNLTKDILSDVNRESGGLLDQACPS